MEFKDILKDERTKRGIKQTELAEKIGVKQKDISRWENGERTPNIENLKKICQALDVSADVMLGIKK